MKSTLPIPDSAHLPVGGHTGRNELPGLSVRTNGIWSLMGNGVFAASQLGMLVVMARLGTQELVGTYALGLALISPIFVLFSLQLRTLFATHMGGDSDLGAYVSVRLTTTGAAMVVAGIVSWRFMPPGAVGVALALAVSKAIDSFQDLAYGVHWRSNRMDFIAKSLLLRGGFGWLAFAATFRFTASVSAAVLALCTAWLVIFVFYDLSVAERMTANRFRLWTIPRWSSATAGRLIWLGVPGGILSWLVALQTSVPRYLVQQDIGEGALGIYCAIASLFVGLELAIVAFNQAAIPQMARFAAERQSAALSQLVRQLTGFGVALGGLLVVGAIWLGPALISMLFGASYARHSNVLLILTCGFAIRTASMPTAMTLRAINAFWSLVAVQFSAIVAVIAASLILIPRFGLEGCAMACVVGFAFDGIGRIALHLHYLVRPATLARLIPDALRAA